MLTRCLLVVVAGLVAAQLLTALPLDSDSLDADTLLKQESEQLSTSLESSGSAPLVREKRTIGFLRQLFPTVSQIIDRKIQAITRIVFRLIGRLVLRGGGGGGGGGDSSDEDTERRVQITLPTFPPSEDDDEEEDEDSTGASDDSTTTTTEPSAEENAVAESKVAPVVVRKTRQAPAQAAAAEEEEEYEDDDQAVAASNDNEVSQSAEEEVEDSESAESEDQRDKRQGGIGGSGGGSGNFLFDIIRLVAGSGTTQSQDEADNAPLDENSTHTDGAEEKHHDDGYSAGVPGPLTRLFVIANRGIANLIQDLILRLAQTSERIVNFKARLITSII